MWQGRGQGSACRQERSRAAANATPRHTGKAQITPNTSSDDASGEPRGFAFDSPWQRRTEVCRCRHTGGEPTLPPRGRQPRVCAVLTRRGNTRNGDRGSIRHHRDSASRSWHIGDVSSNRYRSTTLRRCTATMDLSLRRVRRSSTSMPALSYGAAPIVSAASTSARRETLTVSETDGARHPSVQSWLQCDRGGERLLTGTVGAVCPLVNKWNRWSSDRR